MTLLMGLCSVDALNLGRACVFLGLLDEQRAKYLYWR